MADEHATGRHWLTPVLGTVAGTGTSIAALANLDQISPFLREFGMSSLLVMLGCFALFMMGRSVYSMCISMAPLGIKVVDSHTKMIESSIEGNTQRLDQSERMTVAIEGLRATQQALVQNQDHIVTVVGLLSNDQRKQEMMLHKIWEAVEIEEAGCGSG